MGKNKEKKDRISIPGFFELNIDRLKNSQDPVKEKEKCPHCGRKTLSDYKEFGKICGMCMIWTYEIKNK